MQVVLTAGGRGAVEMEEALRLPPTPFGTLSLGGCCEREVGNVCFGGILEEGGSWLFATMATTASTVKCLMFLPCGERGRSQVGGTKQEESSEDRRVSFEWGGFAYMQPKV